VTPWRLDDGSAVTVVPLDLFFAERHTSASTFAIDTTIAEFRACGDAPP
jgi:hypothetical protein